VAKGPRYRVYFRRRRAGKTDFYYRRRLLSSRIPRFIVRKSLKYISIQIAEAELIGDKILISTHSSELKKKYNWPYGGKNIPAAYLTGLLAGYKAQKAKIEKAILDIGIYRPIVNSKLFAALKGAVDSGFDIPHGENIFPSDDRIAGKDIENYAKMLSEQESEEKPNQFSLYYKNKADPRKISATFEKVKQQIIKDYS